MNSKNNKMRPNRKQVSKVNKEKISPNFEKRIIKSDKSDEERMKMTGPIKKRPFMMKTPVGRRKDTEDSLPSFLVSGRSRRTPKPNPRYANNDMLTPSTKPGYKAFLDYDAEDNDDEEDISESSLLSENYSEDELSEDYISKKRGRPSKNDGKASKSTGRLKRSYTKLDEHEKDQSRSQKKNRRKHYESDDDFDINDEKFFPKYDDQTDSEDEAEDYESSQNYIGKDMQKYAKNTITYPKNDSKKSYLQKTRTSTPKLNTIRRSNKTFNEHETTGTASTIDDFETMPTFTIVNVDDIINKKGDVLIQTPNPTPLTKSNQLNESKDRIRKNTINSINLSRKFDKLKREESLNKNITQKLKEEHEAKKRTYERRNPRILNAVLAKKAAESLSAVNSYEVHGSLLKRVDNNELKLIPTQTSQKNLPPENVIVERKGNKIIRKMTCYEKWYVLRPPDKKPVKVEKPFFNISLTRLGNVLREVVLPSVRWSYKLTLQKIHLSKVAFVTEIYTGDVHDTPVNESEKHNYQPTTIMFRRKSNPDCQIPYDRAVILKNNTFFTNIEGKSIRLLGAPSIINEISQLQLLLEIMDKVTLQDGNVELTTFLV